MEVTKIKCDCCDVEKNQVNHWIVAITHEGMEGILFLPAEAVANPRDAKSTYVDLCGQECAHKRLSAWLDDLTNIDFPVKGAAA